MRRTAEDAIPRPPQPPFSLLPPNAIPPPPIQAPQFLLQQLNYLQLVQNYANPPPVNSTQQPAPKRKRPFPITQPAKRRKAAQEQLPQPSESVPEPSTPQPSQPQYRTVKSTVKIGFRTLFRSGSVSKAKHVQARNTVERDSQLGSQLAHCTLLSLAKFVLEVRSMEDLPKIDQTLLSVLLRGLCGKVSRSTVGKPILEGIQWRSTVGFSHSALYDILARELLTDIKNHLVLNVWSRLHSFARRKLVPNLSRIKLKQIMGKLVEYAEEHTNDFESQAILGKLLEEEKNEQLKKEITAKLEKLIEWVPKKREVMDLLWWNLLLIREGESHKILPIPKLKARYVQYSPPALEVLFDVPRRYKKILETIEEHHPMKQPTASEQEQQVSTEQKPKKKYRTPGYVQLARSHLILGQVMDSGRLRRKLITTEECENILIAKSGPVLHKWHISAVSTDGITVSVFMEMLVEYHKLSKKEYSKKKTLEAVQKRQGVFHTSQLEHCKKEFKDLLNEKQYIYGVDPGIHNIVMGSKVAIDKTAQHKLAFKLTNRQVLKESHKTRNRKRLEKDKKEHGIDKMESNLPAHSEIEEYMKVSLSTMEQRLQFYCKKKYRRLRFDGYMMRQRTIQKFVNNNIEKGSVRTLNHSNFCVGV